MRNTHISLAIAVIAAVTASADIAHAGVSLNGPTGSLFNPNAQVAAPGTAAAGIDYRRISKNGSHTNVIGLATAVGVADGLEISGGYRRLSPTGASDLNDWNIGAKYQILNNKEKKLFVAAGADYTKLQSAGGGHDIDYYAVVTKGFTSNPDRAPIAGTLGVRYDQHSNGGSIANTYIGIGIPLTRTGDWTLLGSVGTKRAQGAKFAYATGLSFKPKGSPLNFTAGIARDTVVAQIGYQFGK